ncbi:MAG: hypothetical protein A2V98_06595 [Planctomycetes bacterium RBG_16_64_12]|nr:MAG: hypothetical protein A2V98_06595 [Planctomycetes bacterium RBG_16_64_12]
MTSNTQTKGPKRSEAVIGKNSSTGPTITSPDTANPNAPASRVPDTRKGRRNKLIAPINNR